jgi:hypothetical protein
MLGYIVISLFYSPQLVASSMCMLHDAFQTQHVCYDSPGRVISPT